MSGQLFLISSAARQRAMRRTPTNSPIPMRTTRSTASHPMIFRRPGLIFKRGSERRARTANMFNVLDPASGGVWWIGTFQELDSARAYRSLTFRSSRDYAVVKEVARRGGRPPESPCSLLFVSVYYSSGRSAAAREAIDLRTPLFQRPRRSVPLPHKSRWAISRVGAIPGVSAHWLGSPTIAKIMKALSSAALLFLRS